MVDPRRTESAAFADLWLGIDVGTDIALSNTMAREIIHDRAHEPRVRRGGTTGLRRVRGERRGLDARARRAGHGGARPRSSARSRAPTRPPTGAMICWTLGITEHHNAVDNVLSLINLGLLTGHVGPVRERAQPAPRAEQRPGWRRHGRDPEQARRGSRTSSRTTRPARGSRPRGACRSCPRYGWHLTDMFQAMERGELTAVYCIGENPAQLRGGHSSTPRSARGARHADRAGHLDDEDR